MKEIYGTVAWHIKLIINVDEAGVITGVGHLNPPDDEEDELERPVNLEGRYDPSNDLFLIKLAFDDESYGWLLILELDDGKSPPILSGKGCLTEDIRAIRSYPLLLDAVRANGELQGAVQNELANEIEFVDPGNFEMSLLGPE